MTRVSGHPLACLLRCSGRGQCDPVSKECRCDPFWTENPVRRYFGDGESNCGSSVLLKSCWTGRSDRHPLTGCSAVSSQSGGFCTSS